jgi:hypothetical protein
MKLVNFMEIIEGDFDENYETREKDQRIWGSKGNFTFLRNDRADQYEMYSKEQAEEIRRFIEDYYERFMVDPEQAYEDQELHYNLVGYKEYRNGDEEVKRISIVPTDDEDEKDLNRYIENFLKTNGRGICIEYIR